MAIPAAGTQIGQYEIVAQVGTGGMATVFKAHHSRLDRDVAIKMMHSMFLTDTNFVSRFEREAKVVGRLDHPTIVPVYDYDLYNNQPYLVMKLVEGQTLKDLLNKGALPLADILRIMTPIADALTYAHSQGVLHRDVKPSNIIIDNNGTPFLTDFGLARIARAGESTMSADMLLGTPYYISPEQAQGGIEIDARADVYSFGVVLYELIVGRLPFTGDTPYIIVHKHIYEPPTPPSQINPEIPPAVEYVLLKALSKDPADRYPTPNALAEALRQAVEETGLENLDASRIEAAKNIPASAPRPQGSPVYRKDSQGNIVSIPSPVAPPVPPNPTESVAQIFTQEGLREIGLRFREAINDIRDQFEHRDQLRQLREGAEKAFVEIRTQVGKAVEENGGEFNFNFGNTPTSAKTDSNIRKNRKVILREWGTDEKSIRARVNERLGRNRGLFGHIVAYMIFSALFLAFTPFIQQIIGRIFEGDETFGVLSTLNVGLMITMLWGGGLLADMADVYYNTGRRLESRRRAINEAMTQRYTADWINIATDKEYKKVRDQVNQRYDSRKDFFQHFFGGFGVVLALEVAWGPLRQVLTSLIGDVDVVRPLLSQNVPTIFALIMGLTVILHGLSVVISPLIGSERHERELEREIERERQFAEQSLGGMYKPKNDTKSKNDAVRLTEDGEFTDSIVEALDEEARRARR